MSPSMLPRTNAQAGSYGEACWEVIMSPSMLSRTSAQAEHGGRYIIGRRSTSNYSRSTGEESSGEVAKRRTPATCLRRYFPATPTEEDNLPRGKLLQQLTPWRPCPWATPTPPVGIAQGNGRPGEYALWRGEE